MEAGMKVLKDTLSEVITSTDDLDRLSNYLDLSCEFQAFSTKDSDNITDVIGQVNSGLNSYNKRLKSLFVLKSLIKQCSSEVFMQNAVKWCGLLLQSLQSHDPPLVKRLDCHNLQALLEHVTSFAEIKREISTTVIPKLITTLLDADEQWLMYSLECLSSCVSLFPGPCGPFKHRLETLAVSLLDHPLSQVTTVGAQLYASLPVCGGGGSRGIKHTEAWLASCDTLIVTLNQVLDELVEHLHLEDSTAERLVSEPLKLDGAPGEEPSRSVCLATRFKNICLYLKSLLTLPLDILIKIPTDDILDTAVRATSLSCKQMMVQPTSERVVLTIVLPIIYHGALELVTGLMIRCKKNMVIHSLTVTYMVVRLLTWTVTEVCGQQNDFSCVRSQLYDTIRCCAATLGPLSGLAGVMDQLVVHFIGDIMPKKDTVKLISVPGSRKRKHSCAPVESITGQGHKNPLVNKDTTLAALKCLKEVLYSCSSQIKDAHFEEMSKVTLELVPSIQRSADRPPPPYSDHVCVNELYNVLLAQVLTVPPSMTLPTDMILVLFSRGLNNTNVDVTSTCRQAIAACRYIMHPVPSGVPGPMVSSPMCSEDSRAQSSTVERNTHVGEVPSVVVMNENVALSMPQVEGSDFTDFPAVVSDTDSVPSLVTFQQDIDKVKVNKTNQQREGPVELSNIESNKSVEASCELKAISELAEVSPRSESNTNFVKSVEMSNTIASGGSDASVEVSEQTECEPIQSSELNDMLSSFVDCEPDD